MCRHLAFVSPEPVTLSTWLFDAPRSLRAQARHPRYQVSGTTNPHGWGVGWYGLGRNQAGRGETSRGETSRGETSRGETSRGETSRGETGRGETGRGGVGRPAPERYRTTMPMWDDAAFAARAAHIATRVAVAAARLASPGMPVEVTGNAPFVAGSLLFSHNGFVPGFHEGVADRLRARVSSRRATGIEGRTDSELLFALVLDRIDDGADGGEALVETARLVEWLSPARLNFLLTDGATVWATAWGNSLFRRGHCVASEPLDEGDGWERVEDRSLVELTASAPTATGRGR